MRYTVNYKHSLTLAAVKLCTVLYFWNMDVGAYSAVDVFGCLASHRFLTMRGGRVVTLA